MRPRRCGSSSSATLSSASIRYRYYVSAVLAEGRQSGAGSVARASANKVEALVVETLRAAYPSDAELDDQGPPARWSSPDQILPSAGPAALLRTRSKPRSKSIAAMDVRLLDTAKRLNPAEGERRRCRRTSRPRS